MRLPSRVLVAVSSDLHAAGPAPLCPGDRHAFQHAAWLSEKTGAELRVAHVVDFFDERLARNIDLGDLERALGSELEALTRGTGASHVIRRGKAWEELLAEVDAFGAEVLVIAPRREDLRLSDRVFHGSTAARVMRRAPCSVWVVARDARVPLERLLALVDGSAMSPQIIETADALAEKLGLERHVMRCLDYPHDLAMHRLPHAQNEIAKYHREVQERARAELAAMTSDAWKVHLGGDWVVREAPRLVNDAEIDLVVLSTGNHPGLSGMMGLTAEKLLERMSASTWLIRPS